ncbi:MAG TPA: GNAT family N-acetyltransferase, partial [Blastocatellia bacterium]|nr:GNAT family N-acetyltransferase [Blastocatellia bacterium]
ERIQIDAWGFKELDVVPSAQLIAAKAAGGMLLGAFDGERLIGFVYGFPGIESGRVSIHSQMLAVRPDCRNLHAGVQLKLAQRKRALEQGIKEISWTFDPLQALNANLNFNRLGVISQRYIVDFYGEETSSPLHQGVGTDRLWVRWLIATDRVRRRIGLERELREADSSVPPIQPMAEPGNGLLSHPGPLVLVRDKGEWIRAADPVAHVKADECMIEGPNDLAALKSESIESARAWRSVIQNAFLVALGAGFVVIEFLTFGPEDSPRRFYLLTKRNLEDIFQFKHL